MSSEANPVNTDHPFGRLLTSDEVLNAIASTGDSTCFACGVSWVMHRVKCAASAETPEGEQS